MKRFLMLCLVLSCLGMASQAAAAPFGIFDCTQSLEENIAASYPGATFIELNNPALLDQGFYFQTIFAADSVIGADSKFFTVGNSRHDFADLEGAWGSNSALENIAGMTVSHGGSVHAFSDLVASICLYVGAGMEYSPEAGLDSLLVEGGTFFVSFAIPGSGNAVDFMFALSSNPMSFKSAPAPAAFILFGTGLAGIIAARRRVRN